MTGGDLHVRDTWLADQGPRRDLNGRQRVAYRAKPEV